MAQILTQANGTITGTIDVISAQPGGAPIRDGPSDHAKARGNAAELMVGQVLGPNTGSIMGTMVYSYVPGRISSD